MSLEYKVLGQSTARPPRSLLALESGGSYKSEDGISWSQGSFPTTASRVTRATSSPEGIVLATTETSVLRSSDGINWTEVTPWLGQIAYGNGVFVGIGGSRNIAYTSSDGISWTGVSIDPTYFLYPSMKFVTFDGSNFIIFAVDEIYERAVFATSTNGSSWSLDSRVAPSGLLNAPNYSGIYADGKLIIGAGELGMDGRIFYKVGAGGEWVEASSSVGFATVVSIAYSGDLYLAAGADGIVYSSTDLATWTQRYSPAPNWPSNYNTRVYYYLDKFFIMTPENLLKYSTDGINWFDVGSESGYDSSSTYPIALTLLEPTSSNVYEVPPSKQAIVSSLYVSNTSASAQTYSVAIVPNGENLSDVNYIRKDVSIDAGDFTIIESKITLSEGDKILTVGSSEEISINMFGVEK